jgi:response regulator RpfG family c-di-GMP phosphodiesterase
MKLIRTPKGESQGNETAGKIEKRWKVLVVDDEPDVHAITRLSLASFSFDHRRLELIHAMSAAEAKAKLVDHHEIAVAIIDIVMESDDAGLKLVDHIRNDLDNRNMRLIIRTGQPGVAPERHVIDHYDIDDYKEKGELTSQRLYTTLRSALKAYRDIEIINANRAGLELILNVSPNFYLHRNHDMASFYRGILQQVTAICRLSHNGFIATINGFVTSLEHGVEIRAAIGRFEQGDGGLDEARRIEEICSRGLIEGRHPDGLPEHALVVPLQTQDQVVGYIYLEGESNLSRDDRHLIHVFANQTASALSNLHLQTDLVEANLQSLHMLAVASEYKDEDTGQHIERISDLVFQLAIQLGLPDETAHQYAEASLLHDVGKLGIPDQILQKPGRLTSDEFEVIKHHAAYGEEILRMNRWLGLARECAATHHERWDGTGYPNGLKGEEIPLIGRITAVADVFDALLSRRPYKEAWPRERAIEEIRQGRGSHFDPEVVDALLYLNDRSVRVAS